MNNTVYPQSLKFLKLTTDSSNWRDDDGTLVRRTVSIAYGGRKDEIALLGNLEHHTTFRREDLIAFAKDVLVAFQPENQGNPIPCTYGTGGKR